MMRQPRHVGVILFQLRGLFLHVVVAIALLAAMAAAQSNPVVIENLQPGTSGWQIDYDSTGGDVNGEIKGYASATSVNKGEDITFYVSVNPVQTYTIDVYRLGWYQGLGGRLMHHIGPLNGVFQATPAPDPTTGLIECRWTPSYTLTTQTSWTSGIYLAVLTNANGYQNYIIFAVRDDSRVAALLYEQPVLSYQAFNGYPDGSGKSLYPFNSYGATTIGGTTAAVKVSFDRPYAGDGGNRLWGNCLFNWELAFIRWLERSGYDVTYQTDIDTHLYPSRLLNYRGFLIGGHNEYTTKTMYDAIETARDAGVNLGVFCANFMHWQVRLESSSSGAPDRVVVCYRDAAIDPVTDLSLKTSLWRFAPLNRPEQMLGGIQYSNMVMTDAQYQYAPYVVTNSGHWVFAGTGFHDGESVPGIVGYEGDRLHSEVALPASVDGTYALLSHSPFTAYNGPDYANSCIYQAPSGAWVFGAGTIYWGHALDDYNPSGPGLADPRIQRMTANILDQFLANAPSGFAIATSPSTEIVEPGDSTSYIATISPIGGFTGEVTLSLSGMPSGASASFTPNPAIASSTLSVTTSPNTPTGTYTLTITGVSGTLTRTTAVTLVVNEPASQDFTLSGSPATETVAPGGSTSFSVTISPIGGFADEVLLSLSGLPSGASGSFTPNPATASSTLSLTTSPSTPMGTYTLSITGVSGSLTHTATAELVVNAPALPDFTLSGSPASWTVTQGGSTSYDVTISPTGGFTGEVTLSLSELPSGASGTFTPNPATGSSVLSVTTGPTTPTGTYTLTITGVSGSLTHTATLVLTVAPVGVRYDNAVRSGFQWGVTSVTTPAFIVGSGANRAAMIMVIMGANSATNITASLGGVSGTVVPGSDTGPTAAIRTLIFQVINPPSGLQTATVSWTTSMIVDIGVITVSGADQVTPCTNGTFAATNRNAGNTMSVTITSNPGDLTASIGASARAWVAPFTNQTLVWGVDSGVAGGDIGAGRGTTTHTWTDAYNYQTHAVSGANFRAPVALLPDFTLSGSPLSQTVTQGGSASYNVTISPTGGFADQVTLSAGGLPSGASGSFTPNPATGSAALSVTTSSNTPTGTHTLTITGVSGSLTHTATIALAISAPVLPDFVLSGSPASQTVMAGNSTSFSITISPTGGFANQVILSVGGLPSGASGSFTPNPATGSATLSVTTSSNTPTGTHTLTITGVSGSLTHTATIALAISAPVFPDFVLSGSPASQAVTPGGSTSYGITISPTGGFGGQVTLSVSGLPSGAGGSFTPNPATASSTLSVTTGASTPTGTYTLTITGVSGSLTHTTAIMLTVSPLGVRYDNAVRSGFQWGVTSVTTPSFVIGSGANRAAMIMVVMGANSATNITASLGGVSGTIIPGTDTGTAATIRTLIFQVVNPPPGPQTATVSWTTSMIVDVGVITVSGADQTIPCTNGTFAATNRNDGSTMSVTITSNPGDLTASIGVSARGWVTPFTNQTLAWGIDSGVVGGDIGAGRGTTTHTWTDAYNFQTHAVSGANFRVHSSQ